MTVQRPIDSARMQSLAALDAVRNAGIRFLLGHVEPDGRVVQAEGRVTTYRVPWALAAGGESVAAHRVLGWIERHGLGADGEFHGANTRDSVANHTFNTYPETCLAYGAYLLRRFDIAQRTFAFAKRYQEPKSGGVFMDRELTGAESPQLVFLTCQFGMSAVLIGDMDAAIGAARWLEKLWEAQPDLPNRLYTVWTPGGGLATTTPEGEDVRHYVNESQEMRQLHYNGGIAASFLGQLYLKTAEMRWLDLARKFQAFSMNSTERQFETRQVCKSAWGAAQLAFATGESRYAAWLERMGDWFQSIQEPDGSWTNSPYLDPNPSIASKIEVTAEFVIHVDAIVSALASRELQPA